MAFRWTTLQSKQWSWQLNGLPVALGICPDYWMWCLRNGFQSAGIYSCTCIAVNPNTQGVCVCVCVLVCVCVCDSKPAVKVYCTWWWNDDNSLVFSEETVKFSADFNSFRRKLEEFDDSKRIVCNQMVAGLLYVDIYTLSTCKTCTWKWNEILRNITALCMFNIFMIPFHASTIMYACLTEKHRTLFRTAFFHSRVTLWCSQLPQRRLLLFAGLKKFGYRQVARAKESFTFGSWDILSALIGSDASWCITVPTVIFFHPKLHYV